jgi:pimeloyl-ACP methyl ester carboxylesterase
MTTDPWFSLRQLLHLYHPNSPLSHPSLTRQAFFSEKTTDSYLVAFHRRLAPYESFLWPLGMLYPFANPAKILASVVGSAKGLKVLVMGGEKDIMTTPAVMRRLAAKLRAQAPMTAGETTDGDEGSMDFTRDGTRCAFVEGAGHHLQNDAQWERGARKLFDFYEQLRA